MFRKSTRMHFIGIGGIGMSGIAEILLNMGFEVSGSDLRESDVTRHLQELGATIYQGHFPSNINDYHVVVTSTAIQQTNPELIEAKKRKIPVVHRSEMLAELVRLRHGIGIAGTHGKTTTSSMMSCVLWHAGINPTSIIGGKVRNFGSNARSGEGDYIVFEADESDGSFLKLLPTIAIVTNIDADHLDHYKYFEGLKDAFVTYLNNVPFYGYSVVCIDDPVVVEVLPRVERPYYTYGLTAGADFRADNLQLEAHGSRFTCWHRDQKLGEVELKLPGRHNVLNSLSVIAVALELDIPFDVIAGGLASFQGVGRRLEVIGEKNGITVIDDYGHHPTEIQATLAALRVQKRRLVVVFQPHRYSRTQLLADDFGRSFADADLVFLTSVYPAGEAPIEGVGSELIVQALKKHEDREAEIIAHHEEIVPRLLEVLQPGDVLVTLGAGDIYKTGPKILESLS